LATIPIPLANPTEKSRLTRLTEQAASLAEAGNMEKLQMVDKEIDAVVYQLFDLTPDEILHIKKSLVNTGREYSDSEYAEDNEQY